MLIEFRAENHRSLREEQALSMAAGLVPQPADERPRMVEGYSEPLLPAAAIYGANASGKSNVLAAFGFMRSAVLNSQRYWGPDDGVPRDPFAWQLTDAQSSTFEATFLTGGTRYEYGFAADSQRIVEEWLFAWPNGKKQTWFERDDTEFTFGSSLRGENKVIQEITRCNALFLSAAVQLKHEQLRPVYEWFLNVQMYPYVSMRAGGYEIVRRPHRLIVNNLDPSHKSDQRPSSPDSLIALQFLEMLRNADVGIDGLRLDPVQNSDGPRSSFRGYQLKHSSTLGDEWFALEEESRGTRRLFVLAVPVLESLRQGSLLIVDELEASLHPSLAQAIIEMFNCPRRNKHNAQLIFTTHDTNLLGTTLGAPVLRRDQVWLTEKKPDGSSELYPLTDFKPRKAENIERGYLQGRYGAIPFLGRFAQATEESSQ